MTVDNHAQAINMLLFVREAWALASDLDIPALSPKPQVRGSSLPASQTVETWEQRWHSQWLRAWEWYELDKSRTTPASPSHMNELARPGQDLNQHIAPFWFVEYGFEGIDEEAFYAWDKFVVSGAVPMDARSHAAELAVASELGLTTIITLPYSGYYAKVLSNSHLVVSNDTMQDSAMFKKALADWGVNS